MDTLFSTVNEYTFPLNVHRVEANSNVVVDRGKVALERGPIVYCLEGVDNNNFYGNMSIPDEAILTTTFDKNTLNGIEIIRGEGVLSTTSKEGIALPPKKQSFVAIPYYSWSNRGTTQMEVWLPRK